MLKGVKVNYIKIFAQLFLKVDKVDYNFAQLFLKVDPSPSQALHSV
jgi:hypothetical protein